jgi:hypothetical protein
LRIFASSYRHRNVSVSIDRRVRMDTNAWAPCLAGHVISLKPFAFFHRFIEAAQVSDVLVIRSLWSFACLTSFQTLDRNGAAGKEEDI